MARTQTRSMDGERKAGGLVRPGLASMDTLRIELDARTAYDFLMSICEMCGNVEDELPEDRRWHEEARAALIDELGGGVASLCVGLASELGSLLVSHPDVRTARQVAGLVDDLPDEELTRALFAELLSDPDFAEVTERAIHGDDAAFAELSTRLEQMKGHEILPLLPRDHTALVRRAIKAWLPRFEKVEDRIGRMVERDVASRRLEDARRDPVGFIEEVTNGIRFAPEPGVRRVVLAASYFSRPYNSISKVGDTRIIVYPIADESLGAADRLAPSPATVRLFRALGDESRLRILRLLSERDWYLTELATELDLSKPTIKHHLAQLRSAGLVTMTEEGNLTYYSLRRGRIAEAGSELRAYVGR